MKNGDYILVVAPDGYSGMKYRGRYCYEHHLVWWLSGMKMPQGGEVVHHKNHNKFVGTIWSGATVGLMQNAGSVVSK